MRAAVVERPGTAMLIEDVSLQPLGDRDVRIRTMATGVCHSDLSFLDGVNGLPAMFPMVMGHEAVGEVVEIGAGVSRCRVGDSVVCTIRSACGECWHCQRSETQHCELMDELATAYHFDRPDGSRALALSALGAFAEMFQTSETLVIPIQTDLPHEQVALVGCGVTTGVGAALWTAQVKPGSTVAVFGCGGIGQSVIQGARLAGAERIFAVDPVALKREAAIGFGATDVVDPADGDPVASLRAATGGRGVDYAFEAAGHPAVTRQAFDATRRHGTTVAVGMPPNGAEYSLPGRAFFIEEKRLLGSFYGSAQARVHLPQLIRLAEQGKLNLEAMVSRRIALEDLDDAFAAMRSGEVIRSVVGFE